MSSYRVVLLVCAISCAALCICCISSANKSTNTVRPGTHWGHGKLSLIMEDTSSEASALQGTFYVSKRGLEMAGPKGRSYDNGKTWQKAPPLSYCFVDPITNTLLQIRTTMDVKVDPSVREPREGITNYYLKYLVSNDGGKTFIVNDPIKQEGYTKDHPFFNVMCGKNGFMLGDAGSVPIRTSDGRILVPAEAFVADANWKLYNPGGGYTYTEAMVIVGSWIDDGHINWELKQTVRGDPAKSTRGMDEPTLAELTDGRILMVMRGSNGGWRDPDFHLPCYKWYSISEDGGYSWSKPLPWCYDNGELFFSPASMSRLFVHSNGRIYWIGNISPENCKGNNPRYPLVIAELNPLSSMLCKDSVTILDTLKESDKEGLILSHFQVFEDRITSEIVISMPRFNSSYTKMKPIVFRISVFM